MTRAEYDREWKALRDRGAPYADVLALQKRARDERLVLQFRAKEAARLASEAV